ncbi:hypothetical protein Patl1_19252 [Pistacia atlantica]|uniref:Uncharacterized protein n=1 Tax=Pistacia atlantica TaxID=434234 RepID=A0ACC1C1B8_9ROSI|nr:hypothetical protein Patl1_19252 [Pistacia atlantica]
MMKQQQGSSVWGGPQSQAKATTGLYQMDLNRVHSRNTTRPLGLSPSAWPPLQKAQQQHVFLPCRVNTPTETHKKPGPALNLKFNMGVPFQPYFGSYAPETDANLRYRNGYQKCNLGQQQGMNHEIRLPQEWTY